MTTRSPGFAITGGCGFHVTFANGWTVSVQFGGGNHCDNYDMEIGSERRRNIESSNAEVAAWSASGTMIDWPDGDTVTPRKTPAEVLAILTLAAHAAPDATQLYPKAEGVA